MLDRIIPVWLLSTSSSDPHSIKMAHFHLALDLSPDEPTPVSILDLNFFTSSEIILVLSVGPPSSAEHQVLLASIAYTELECFSVPLPPSHPSPVDHVLDTLLPLLDSDLPPREYLPLARVRHLEALDRMPIEENGGERAVELALNGRKGRMTGSLLVWGGREVEVFDLEEDEGVEEEQEEEEEEGGEMED